MNHRQKYYYFFKRGVDLIFGWVGLIIGLPFLVLIGVIIKFESKGPVLFTQKRIGKDKKHFTIYKFRTMRMDTPKNTPTHQLANPDQWITNVGKVLRKTSLDEIPQIINIAFGQMSFIGPRPALWNQDDLIRERDIYNVHRVLPGVTGFAQVNGRDALLIKEKVKLDGMYVTHFGVLMDVKISVKTVIAVFKKAGVVEGGTGSLGQSEASDD